MTPDAVVQRQLEAYNARDVAAWLATYHPDAEQYLLHGERVARGHAELEARIRPRFAEPNLHARLLGRTVLAPFVFDHERVTRSFPEGPGHLDMLCIYEVHDGLITRASFAFGAPVLDPVPA